MTQQHTAKELWGAKRDAAAAGVAPAFGANRWDLAEFSDTQQTLKFQRLLGAHKSGAAAAAAPGPQLPASPAAAAIGSRQEGERSAAAVDGSGPRVLSKDEQKRVLTDVELQFAAGLRRADGRTVGLGL